jgi:signal transduction histidine kinase
LVQQIVEAHRGRVSVETSRGKGAAFIIYLPTATGDMR